MDTRTDQIVIPRDMRHQVELANKGFEPVPDEYIEDAVKSLNGKKRGFVKKGISLADYMKKQELIKKKNARRTKNKTAKKSRKKNRNN